MIRWSLRPIWGIKPMNSTAAEEVLAERSSPMLEVSHLNVWYGVTEVLRDVSFTVPENKIVSLLGGTGSGKTECFLLPIVASIIRESATWPVPGQRPHQWDWWNHFTMQGMNRRWEPRI